MDGRKIRNAVSQAYSRAVTNATPDRGCCSAGAPPSGGAAVAGAGYLPGDLAGLPSTAVASSFGCGNPVAFTGLREGDVVLDLGSGAGIDLLLAARKVGDTGRVIGIDMTDAMIARARENIAASGLSNVEVRKGIIEEMPVEDSSVDWIISNCVINLSPEKHRVFAEMARILKPGGRVLVSDIIADDLPPRLRHDQALYNSCLAGAVGEEEYLGGMRKAGLADVEIRERLVYEPEQLRRFLQPEAAGGSGCCGSETSLDQAESEQLVAKLEGKVCSALIYGRNSFEA